MSVQLRSYVVIGVRLNVQATEELIDAIENSDSAIELFYDDETSEKPVIGEKIAECREDSESGSMELVFPVNAYIAKSLRSFGLEVDSADIRKYFVKTWG